MPVTADGPDCDDGNGGCEIVVVVFAEILLRSLNALLAFPLCVFWADGTLLKRQRQTQKNRYNGTKKRKIM